jgi:hypothetical protein
VASVAHLAPIYLGLNVHKDTFSAAILALTATGPTWSGWPTMRHRCAGSLAASQIPSCWQPATRLAQQATS